MSKRTPGEVIARFGTLLGAVVTLTATGQYTSATWFCDGCQADAEPEHESGARRHANEHAAICRALPATA